MNQNRSLILFVIVVIRIIIFVFVLLLTNYIFSDSTAPIMIKILVGGVLGGLLICVRLRLLLVVASALLGGTVAWLIDGRGAALSGIFIGGLLAICWLALVDTGCRQPR
jgi:hypothetical protein